MVDEITIAPGGGAAAESDSWVSGGDVRQGSCRCLPDPPLRREPVAGEVDVQYFVVIGHMHIRRIPFQQGIDGVGPAPGHDLPERFDQQLAKGCEVGCRRARDLVIRQHLARGSPQVRGIRSVRDVDREPGHVGEVISVSHLTAYIANLMVSGMITNDPYVPGTVQPGTGQRMARLASRLRLDGEWDGALVMLADLGEDVGGLRAEILTDRYCWRLDDPMPAEQAVAGLEDHALRGYLAAQLAYTRTVFSLGRRPDDEQVIHAGLREAARHEELRAWSTFWQGVVADNVHADHDTARQRYDEALALSRSSGDLLLESYVVRHQAGHLIDSDSPGGEALLRRSLHLRSALGARPQTAAAQATLADVLKPGPERDTLLQAARATASELGLAWLNDQLAPATA